MTTTGTMDNTLIAEPMVAVRTIAELEREIEALELVYGMTTEQFLERYNDSSDPLADVEDAELWFEWHSSLIRMREEGEEPPIWTTNGRPGKPFEGLKEPSNYFYGLGALRCYGYRDLGCSKKALSKGNQSFPPGAPQQY